MARQATSGQAKHVTVVEGSYELSEDDDFVCLGEGWAGGTLTLPGPSSGHGAPNGGDEYTIADPLLVISGGALTVAGGGYEFVCNGTLGHSATVSSLLSSSSGFGSTGVTFVFSDQQQVWIVLE